MSETPLKYQLFAGLIASAAAGVFLGPLAMSTALAQMPVVGGLTAAIASSFSSAVIGSQVAVGVLSMGVICAGLAVKEGVLEALRGWRALKNVFSKNPGAAPKKGLKKNLKTHAQTSSRTRANESKQRSASETRAKETPTPKKRFKDPKAARLARAMEEFKRNSR